MASNSYIQRNATLLPSANGKRLNININSIGRVKGTNTIDLPIPSKSSDLRQLLPITGQLNDFTIGITLREEDSNIGNSVSSGGSLSSDSIQTIVQQYNYLFDELLSSDINKKYTLYLDWLNKTYIGQLTINSQATKDDFTGEVEVTLNFKEGGNFLSV